MFAQLVVIDKIKSIIDNIAMSSKLSIMYKP